MHLPFISYSHSPSRSLKSMRKRAQASVKAAVTCTVSMITEKEFSTQSLANKYWQIPLKVKYLLSKLLKWAWPVTEHSPEKHREPLITSAQADSKILPTPISHWKRRSSPWSRLHKAQVPCRSEISTKMLMSLFIPVNHYQLLQQHQQNLENIV